MKIRIVYQNGDIEYIFKKDGQHYSLEKGDLSQTCVEIPIAFVIRSGVRLFEFEDAIDGYITED